MTKYSSEAGFSAVELLISIIVAVAFIGAGYQLYSIVIKDGAEARYRARASNLAYTNLRLYAAQVANPCIPITSTPISLPTTTILPSPAAMSYTVTCPYGSDPVSRVAISVTYGSPQQEVVHAIFATK